MKKFSNCNPHSRFTTASASNLRQEPKGRRKGVNIDNFRDQILAIAKPQSKGLVRSSIQRARTGKLDRGEIVNRQITKNTIKKLKKHNPEKNINYQRHISSLKKYINEVNHTYNQIIQSKTYFNTHQSRKPMHQICFTQIQQEKIEAQKGFLNQFHHLSKSLPKMIETGFSPEQAIKENQERILSSLRLIDSIYIVLRDFQEDGYSLKTNKFVIDYCRKGHLSLKQIFLSQSKKMRDPFKLVVPFEAIQTAELAKKRLITFLTKPHCQSMYTIQKQIQGLLDYLENELSQKKIGRLLSVTNDINTYIKKDEGKIYSSYRFSKMNEHLLKLNKDMQAAEEELGPMHEISKISRKKHDLLNKTYTQLHTIL